MIPLSRQIRSNSTSPPLPNRSVNCLPLSVSTSSGTPNSASAAANARHTARPVARATTSQITQDREWSSRPVTIFASVPSAKNAPPMMPICHSAIGASRSHRRQLSLRRLRVPGSIRPWRTSARQALIRDGTGDTPALPSS